MYRSRRRREWIYDPPVAASGSLWGLNGAVQEVRTAAGHIFVEGGHSLISPSVLARTEFPSAVIYWRQLKALTSLQGYIGGFFVVCAPLDRGVGGGIGNLVNSGKKAGKRAG